MIDAFLDSISNPVQCVNANQHIHTVQHTVRTSCMSPAVASGWAVRGSPDATTWPSFWSATSISSAKSSFCSFHSSRLVISAPNGPFERSSFQKRLYIYHTSTLLRADISISAPCLASPSSQFPDSHFPQGMSIADPPSRLVFTQIVCPQACIRTPEYAAHGRP